MNLNVKLLTAPILALLLTACGTDFTDSSMSKKHAVAYDADLESCPVDGVVATLGQGADETTGKGEEPADETEGAPNEDQGKDPGKDTGKDTGKDPGTDPSKDPGKDPGKDPSKDPGKDPSKDPSKDPGKDPSKEPGRKCPPKKPQDPNPTPAPQPQDPQDEPGRDGKNCPTDKKSKNKKNKRCPTGGGSQDPSSGDPKPGLFMLDL